MSTPLRSRLVDRMREVLDDRTRNLPDSIPFSMDVGPLADAVIDEMTEGSGVPRIPTYDHTVWTRRRWTEPFVQAEVMSGAAVRALGVFVDGDRMIVRVEVDKETVVNVSLPVADAEEFLVAGLAAVDFIRSS